MKVISTFALVLFTLFANAQLIVDDNGDVGVGSYFENNSSVPSNSAFHVSGIAYINGGVGSGVTIEDYVGDVILRGGFNNGGYLGKHDQRWGNIYTNRINGAIYTTSDISIKENIRPLESAISKIMLINPVVYDIKESYFADSEESNFASLVEESKSTTGVIAQELKEIYPKLVHFDEHANLHEVNYQGLIPHLVKAIQEQQAIINELKSKVDQLATDK